MLFRSRNAHPAFPPQNTADLLPFHNENLTSYSSPFHCSYTVTVQRMAGTVAIIHFLCFIHTVCTRSLQINSYLCLIHTSCTVSLQINGYICKSIRAEMFQNLRPYRFSHHPVKILRQRFNPRHISMHSHTRLVKS